MINNQCYRKKRATAACYSLKYSQSLSDRQALTSDVATTLTRPDGVDRMNVDMAL